MTMNQLQALSDIFGYAVEIDGDNMVASVYSGSYYLFETTLL
jgi:hypothetical protein